MQTHIHRHSYNMFVALSLCLAHSSLSVERTRLQQKRDAGNGEMIETSDTMKFPCSEWVFTFCPACDDVALAVEIGGEGCWYCYCYQCNYSFDVCMLACYFLLQKVSTLCTLRTRTKLGFDKWSTFLTCIKRSHFGDIFSRDYCNFIVI